MAIKIPLTQYGWKSSHIRCCFNITYSGWRWKLRITNSSVKKPQEKPKGEPQKLIVSTHLCSTHQGSILYTAVPTQAAQLSCWFVPINATGFLKEGNKDILLVSSVIIHPLPFTDTAGTQREGTSKLMQSTLLHRCQIASISNCCHLIWFRKTPFYTFPLQILECN